MMKKTLILLWSILSGLVCGALGETSFYTLPKPDANGGVVGRVEQGLTYALALERDRTSCYKGVLSEGGKRFEFKGLPTGKYDLVLFLKDRRVVEGLFLGEGSESLVGKGRENFEERLQKADAFFNKYKLHRFGLVEGGTRILAFVERVRDKLALTGGGEALKGPVRRFEIAELDKASDTWTLLVNRHMYREEDAPGKNDFLDSLHLPALGGIRVIQSPKDLGTVSLTP
jgi:hypothetical protein